LPRFRPSSPATSFRSGASIVTWGGRAWMIWGEKNWRKISKCWKNNGLEGENFLRPADSIHAVAGDLLSRGYAGADPPLANFWSGWRCAWGASVRDRITPQTVLR